ncbi:superfamily II DNA helicase [Rossellomorea vietnamensis]|uniref:Superfamily II DNA helicase n=1 Tax=Rossellomorea vietnamensis TaxID=218284 RepID=A0A5D4KAG8_9BACI|nr:RQC-minor-1 family DNA-binding protein [Rossellomorea vietnamensis]TYR74374.1 superfamily II DNA helicase [Rossellomorea vietnamensis]
MTVSISLSHEEIRAILRGADAIIAQGGRTLLAKILKGSREKKVLELKLDKSPVYGRFRSEKLDNIMLKIDWMIDHDFLEIEYFGKLPMIVYTERGWLIESDQYTDEFISEWEEWISQKKENPDMTYLKDRNRQMILLMLQKIKESGNKDFIPYLKLWKEIDYKKVKTEIQNTIEALEASEPVDEAAARERQSRIHEALKGAAPEDFLLKCYECGDRFLFTVGEQQFYKQKGFDLPKRCGDCRELNLEHSYW